MLEKIKQKGLEEKEKKYLCESKFFFQMGKPYYLKIVENRRVGLFRALPSPVMEQSHSLILVIGYLI